MGVEYELKFRADRAVQAAILAQVPGEDRHFAMQTTYYDTPTGQLSARRHTLRLRLENKLSVCTLKAPEKGAGRGEWEVEAASNMEGIMKLCRSGADLELMRATAGGLMEVCGARFTRLAAPLEIPGAKVELALDQGVLMGRGKELPFAEVEVELKEGADEAAVAFARALAEEFGLVPEEKSKFARAMALAMT